MRSAKTAMASDVMLDLGRYHLAALAQSESTKQLASVFQSVQDELQTATTARVDAEKAMTVPRVSVRFSENALERAIRQVALLAHGADNNATTGPAFKALFPNGLDAELRPIGPSQVAAAVALRERLNTQPASAKVKAQAMDDFDKALATFKSAVYSC
jgi:hypothetical protein